MRVSVVELVVNPRRSALPSPITRAKHNHARVQRQQQEGEEVEEETAKSGFASKVITSTMVYMVTANVRLFLSA